MARDDDDDDDDDNDDFGCAVCRAADYCGNGAAEATCQQYERIQPAVKERFTRPDTPSQTPIAPSYEALVSYLSPPAWDGFQRARPGRLKLNRL